MTEKDFEQDSFSSEDHHDPMILGKKIKKDDFEHLMGFYEADHKLNTEERHIMLKDLTSSGVTTMIWALIDSSIVVTTPFIYRRYQEKKLGGPLPVLPRSTAFLKLIFFLVAGISVYFWSSKYHAKNDQQYRVANLEADCSSGKFSEQEIESKQRLLNVWKSLDPRNLSLFTVYYYKSASDPSLVMKSPKDMVSFDPHAVTYLPPPQKNGQLQGVLGAVKEHEKQAPHWQKIREVNGFVSPTDDGSDSSASIDDSQVLDDARAAEDPAFEQWKEPAAKTSAWDRLRKGN
ncbi:hypothetical protein METBIDRAFT_13071 [Metschnikowia bicuspidata var. bicuspidata NRRL YB-4993]|uniref:Uncharacterized protein n=1 Tax=Metschnikowia bicuspidata var. bicuspidata NRRL YB-4993 TaxID=869754 RepID=A0A1A0H828_9ASCO|nr:hypothetical protein METBIDRAFT_13071 [Metschnikowia bicuspidata var. bicuspidata NRRL YB-4993]OBA20047.1 hypothetical protein METBIDRAFT_13071 [Metschnikowia bicuspidata var. bicuspidata NRRL YB-4993]